MDFAQYSEESLKIFQKEIIIELNKRQQKKFANNYKVNECYRHGNFLYRITEIIDNKLCYEVITIRENYISIDDDSLFLREDIFAGATKFNLIRYNKIREMIKIAEEKKDKIYSDLFNDCVKYMDKIESF